MEIVKQYYGKLFKFAAGCNVLLPPCLFSEKMKRRISRTKLKLGNVEKRVFARECMCHCAVELP